MRFHVLRQLAVVVSVLYSIMFMSNTNTKTHIVKAQAVTPDYRIPCKVTSTGNWKIVRDAKSWTDQQLLADINTNGKVAHGYPAIDLNNNTSNRGTRTYGICDDLTILSAREGVVIYNDYCSDSTCGAGWLVKIRHDDGQISNYAHMAAKSSLVLNTRYPEGTVVGTMGRTGWADGIHLHFDIGTNPNNISERTSNWVFKHPFSQPYGYIDSPSAGSTQVGTALIGGWAKVDGSTISRVEIWIDGVYRANATYGIARPDVGGNYGYHWQWDTTTYPNGAHSIQVKAVAANGGSALLPRDGQTTIQVNIQNPQGYIDVPTDGATVNGTVRIAGWAAVTGSNIDRIEIWIDGQIQGNASYGFFRSDLGGNYGYEWNWDTTHHTNGQHTIQVKAIAANGGSVFLIANNTPDLRRVQVDLQNPPLNSASTAR